MNRKTFARIPLVVALGLTLGLHAPATAKELLGNNPPNGVRHGTVRHAGSSLVVKLVKSRRTFTPDLNNSRLTITEVAPGTGAAPIYDATEAGIPFDDTFPNGAYLITDEASLNTLYGRKAECRQLKTEGGAAWDSSRVYCDRTGIARIKITTGPGDDKVIIDPSVTVPVTTKCLAKQTRCGQSCFETDAYECCDPIDGCYAGPSSSCAEVCLD